MGTVTQPHIAYNTALLTDTVTIDMSFMPVENPGVIAFLVFYNAIFDDDTVKVASIQVDGIDATRIQTNPFVGDLTIEPVTIEHWYIDIASLASNPMTSAVVQFVSGSSYNIVAVALDFPQALINQYFTFADNHDGLTSPATTLLDWYSASANKAGTVFTPMDQYLNCAAAIMFKAASASTMSLSVAPAGYSEVLPPLTVGGVGNKITVGVVVSPVSGSTDTYSWSLSIARPWRAISFQVAPAAITRPIPQAGILPQVAW